jgi:hypothetical protein
VKIYCNIVYPKIAQQPEIEMGKNLKGRFSQSTFYGLHAGNNQISILKPYCKFAFPEP